MKLGNRTDLNENIRLLIMSNDDHEERFEALSRKIALQTLELSNLKNDFENYKKLKQYNESF